MLAKQGYIDCERFTINRSLLKSVVTHYVQDLQVLKLRYGITGKAQPQKAAGLTAAAVMRFKPVLPKNPSDENLFEQEANELLAIFHGLCVCSELGNDKIDLRFVENFLARTESAEWASNLRYLLKHRNYTPESLAMVFDTLVRFAK
ncbi:MAG: hypothetical protein LBB36_03735 [Fibromonadaceae bacterium]|nr:hypothetical protein [Fibromonadaceae bacterium]